MFVGYKKPWVKHRQRISNIAVKSLLDLVRSVRSDDLENLQVVQG